LVGHSHLDIAYYWRRIHTVQKNARTVLIQMRLMDQYPQFKYTHTQPYTYELLEQYYPELFEELKEKIASGNFEPVGAMYVEPDCNVPSAESLIRQCLYGQLYYKEKFGIKVNNCWLPDVFGNSWILPQIMKKSGVEYFVSNKMSTWNDTNRFPHNNFIWKGIDGSKYMLVYHQPILLLGICQVKSKKTGRLIKTKKQVDKPSPCLAMVMVALEQQKK
jgi:alpha-mannosidase